MDTFCVCRFDDDGHPNVGMPCFSTTASATCILADMMYSHTQGTKPEVCYCVWSQIFEVTALTALPLGCSPCHKNCLVQKLTISVHQSTIKKNVSYQGHCKPQKMPRPLQATKDVKAHFVAHFVGFLSYGFSGTKREAKALSSGAGFRSSLQPP